MFNDVAGIRPAIQGGKTSSVFGKRISNELIAKVNPDYIFIVDRNADVLGKATRKKEIENKLIQQTTAYRYLTAVPYQILIIIFLPQAATSATGLRRPKK